MHKHHIVPRHMGGSDDPSNLIELTVEQHAEAHRVLYEKYGKKEDWLAWKGLLGEMNSEEIIAEARRLGGKKGGDSNKNPFRDPEWQKSNNPRLNSEKQKEWQKLTNTPEAIAKKKETFKKIGHQQGEKNSSYGTRWIHSLVEKRSTRVKKDDPLPEGWLEGRKIKFDEA
jgi:hypothetical protein